MAGEIVLDFQSVCKGIVLPLIALQIITVGVLYAILSTEKGFETFRSIQDSILGIADDSTVAKAEAPPEEEEEVLPRRSSRRIPTRQTLPKEPSQKSKERTTYEKIVNPNPIDYNEEYKRRVASYRSTVEASLENSPKKTPKQRQTGDSASPSRPKRTLTAPATIATTRSTRKRTAETSPKRKTRRKSTTLVSESYEETYRKRVREFQGMYDAESTPLRKRRLRNKKVIGL